MKDHNEDPRSWFGDAPVTAYAIIIGVLLIGALVFGTQYGRAKQNPIPSVTPTARASA